MICQNCNKNQATVHYKQTINGKHKEMYLCPECYQQMQGLNEFGWTSLFGGLVPNRSQVLQCKKCGTTYDHFVNGEKFGCANCYEVFDEKMDQILKRLHGSSLHQGRLPKEFQTIGKASSFHDKLNEHVKKVSKRKKDNEEFEPKEDVSNKKSFADPKLEKIHNKINVLKQEMADAVKVEDYVLAAKLRDEIKKLERKMEGGENK